MTEQPDTQTEVNPFFQRPVFNCFERLLAGHLLEASKGEKPLETVIHIARAALSLTKEAAATLQIDQNLAASLFTVAQRMSTATKVTNRDGDEKYVIHLYSVKMDKDIKPWKKMEAYGYTYTEQEKKVIEEIQKDKEAIFYEALRRLTPAGYQNMVSDFLLFSIPVVEEMSRKLATLVSPETYTELLRLYYGEKKAT